jgi:TP901 family phage tail tape measure protein
MASLFDLFVSISGDNSGFKRSIKDSQKDVSDFGTLAENVTGKIGDAFASLGVKMTAAGIGAFLIKTGTDFQAASNQIQKTTGETGEALASLDTSFKHLYASSARSSEEIAGGLAKLRVETKQTGQALEDLTAANLRFAKVTSSDVASAVDETQAIFKQFNVQAVDQADALDVLYGTMTATGLSLGELSSQMTAVGPTARAFGMSFVETAALVGSFKEAGLQASDVTRGLNALLVKFAEAGKDPKQALAELIEKLKDASTETAALNELVDAGFSKRAAVAMVDAARRGALDLGEFTKRLTESKGKVKEIADQTSSFTDELKKLGHEVALVGGAAGEPLIQVFTAIFKSIRQANDEFALWEAKVAKWLRDQGTFAYTDKIGGFLNNLLNPWASGNYIDNFMNPGRPSAPGAPKTIAAGLTVPPAGTGDGGGHGLDSGAIKQAYGALGLTDLEQQLKAATEAFNLLSSAGKLNAGQMEEAARYVDGLRKKIADLANGILSATKEPTAESLILTETFKQLVSQQEKLIVDAARLRQIDPLAWAKEAEPAVGPIERIAGAFDALVPIGGGAWTALTEGAKFFGIVLRSTLTDLAELARQNFEAMKASGLATQHELDEAFTLYKLHQIELDHDLGTTDDDLYAQQKQNAEDTLAKIRGKSSDSTKQQIKDRYDLARETEAAAHQMFGSLERGFAADIIAGKGWGKTLTDVAKTTATDMLSIMLKGFLKPLEDQFAKLATKIGGWLSGIWGGGSSAASTAAGGAAPAAGAAASSASGAASSAGGVLGAVGAIGAAVGAVSSVIGNFQMAGMNKSLDVLVNHTLRIYNELYNFRMDAWTREGHLFLKLDDMWNEIRNVVAAVKAGGGGTGKGGLTFNNCNFNGTPQQNAAAIFQYAELAGAL